MGDWLSCKDLQLYTFSSCLTRLVHFLLKHFSWKERRQGEQSNLQNLWIHPCMWSMSWALTRLMKFPEHGILVIVGRKSTNACHGWLLPACITNSSFIEITLCLLSHFPSFSLQRFIGTSCLFLVITSYCYGLYVVCNCRKIQPWNDACLLWFSLHQCQSSLCQLKVSLLCDQVRRCSFVCLFYINVSKPESASEFECCFVIFVQDNVW